MTEQELLKKIGTLTTPEHLLECAKSYADARESKVIAELKAESKYWKDRWEAGNKSHDAEFSSIIAQNAENKRLNAEIKRLRDALIWLKVNRTPDRAMIEVFIDKAISPAPVTETTTDFQFRNRPQDTTLNYPSSKPQWLTANDNLYRLDTFTQSQIINMGGMDYDCNIRGIITEDHGDAGWIAYSKDIKGTVGQGLTKKEACDEFCNSLIAIVLFLSREAAPVTEDEDYDPEFCPQCNSMEWYNGDGECEYGCHHCGHVWIHGTPLNEDQE
jgi:hypothetical protein